MNFFVFRTVFKAKVSRVFPGYFFSFLIIIAACNNANEKKPEIKIAKTVPANYKNDYDRGFTRHQDTVLYRDKYFTGYLFSLYPNNDTEFVKSYFNGVEEGWQKKWYPNKQLAEERFYINGKKEGTHQGWWPDGKQKFIFEAVNDEYNGEFKEWYSSGLLGKQFHYINGQEEGSERLWWDNGTIRANYVIRNGRKYGLIGLTVCKNPYDSVIKK
jgi:antitoxin component YwqK of YwqJK toxin-antitoxin module